MTDDELTEVLAEIAEWPLDLRRRYISDIETVFGKAAGDQLREGLKRIWEEKKWTKE
jgi:hypothetical protein